MTGLLPFVVDSVKPCTDRSWPKQNRFTPFKNVPCITRSKREASSQNLTRKTFPMLNIPYNFLNGFELISKMTCGISQSAEIRRSAEKSHVWVWGACGQCTVSVGSLWTVYNQNGDLVDYLQPMCYTCGQFMASVENLGTANSHCVQLMDSVCPVWRIWGLLMATVFSSWAVYAQCGESGDC